MLPVSKDTLLRVVRRRSVEPSERLRVVGIDDWAIRRNHRYGTVVCNLERRKVVALLPDREQATTRAWLAVRPEIEIVARDRGGGYGEAVARALPHAIQVADRWHLMENTSRPVVDAVRKSMRDIRRAIGATTIDPDLLTAAERLQYEGCLRREEANAAVMSLVGAGIAIKEIVRRTGLQSRYRPPESCAAIVMRSFAFGRARSTCTCRGSTLCGVLAVAMAPSCGGVFELKAFEAPCA